MIARSTTGFPALRKLFRDEFPPLLRAVDPFLRNLNPILTGLDLYKHEITAAMANVTAATNAVHLGATGDKIHYIRTLGPFTPESLATFHSRPESTTATPPTRQPLPTRSSPAACPTSTPANAAPASPPTLSPETPKDPAFSERVECEGEERTPGGQPKNRRSTSSNDCGNSRSAEQETRPTPRAPACSAQAALRADLRQAAAATAYQQTFEQGK